MRKSRFLYILIFVFLISGCGSFYSIETSIKPPNIRTVNVTNKSGVTHIPVWHYQGRPSIDNIYTDGKNLYFLYWDRKFRKYNLVGITHSLEKEERNKNKILTGLTKVKMESYKNGYHAYIPELDLYIYVTRKNTYRSSIAVITDLYDVVVEYTNSYQNDPGFLKILKKNREKQKRQMLIHNIENFVQRYNISDIIDPTKSSWEPKNSVNDIILNGQGILKLVYKDRTYADVVEINGNFDNGYLNGEADITVRGSYCTLKVLVCLKGVKDAHKYKANSASLSSVIRQGFKEIVNSVRQKAEAYYRSIHPT
jgi:hypothetical protein